jgi:hypothetical protein
MSDGLDKHQGEQLSLISTFVTRGTGIWPKGR